MAWNIESAGIVADYPGKGHDRILFDDERRLYAVLDGAGNAVHSDVAIDQLPTIFDNERRDDDLSESKYPEAHLIRVASRLSMSNLSTQSHELVRGVKLSAGGLLMARIDRRYPSVTYGGFGDSSIFMFDNVTNEFCRLAGDPQPSDRAETEKFLGNEFHEFDLFKSGVVQTKNYLSDTKRKNFAFQEARLVPEGDWEYLPDDYPAEEFARYRFVLLSDGAYDFDGGQGVPTGAIRDILAQAGRPSSAKIAKDISEAIQQPYDDSAVVVVTLENVPEENDYESKHEYN